MNDTKLIDIGDIEVRRDMINSMESSMYGTKNVDGEEVMVFLQNGEGMEIHTFQSNGWLRVNYYDKDGYAEGETFKGRWDKE